jgi:hypothetical protein
LYIKTVLEEFGNLSGLVCNVEKTVILPIGNNVNDDERIAMLGFKLVETVTILGLEINGNGFTEGNFESITQKIRNQLGTWRPFILSLPGRINIAKSMLYSQINYLGCFLPMPIATTRTIDTLITDYVKGNLNIAKKRLYLAPEHGGLGLFDKDDFLDSQKCSWIKRSVGLNEPWKVILYVSNFGVVFNSKKRNINVDEYPICNQICASYEKFLNAFTAANENYPKIFIFENDKIATELDGRESFSRVLFLPEIFNQYSSKLYQLRYMDLFDEDNNFLNIQQLRDRTSIDFTPLQVFHLRNACWVARTRYNKKDPLKQISIQIETFLFRRKKGSSHIRKVLSNKPNLGIPHSINKLANNLDIVINGEQSKFLNKLWTDNFFSNHERVFFFKLHNNILGYNNVVSHFVRGHTPYCTFCNISRTPDPNPETPVHLFYDCNRVHNLLVDIFKTIVDDNNFAFSKREFFTKFERKELSGAKNGCLTICAKLLVKYVWECRNRSFLPFFEHCLHNLRDRLLLAIKSNNKFKKLWEASGLFELEPINASP